MYLELLKECITKVNRHILNSPVKYNFELKYTSYPDPMFENKNQALVMISNSRKVLFRRILVIDKDRTDGIELCAKDVLEGVITYGLIGCNTFMQESKLFNTEL